MATRKAKMPEHWQITGSGQSPAGPYSTWTNVETEEVIQLPAGLMPDEKTLKLLVLNGAIPRAPEGLPAGAEPDDPFAEGDQLSSTPEETALDRVLSVIQDRRGANEKSMIRIFRLREGKDDSYCCELSPEAFEESNTEYIRKYFGGGTYRIVVWGPTPRFEEDGVTPRRHGGRYARLAAKVITIDQSTIPVDPNDPALKATGGLMPSAIEKILEKLAEPKPDPMQTFMQNVQMFQQMQAVFGGGQNIQQPAKSLVEQMADMAALKQAAKEITGDEGGGTEPSMMSMAMKALEVIGPNLRGSNPAPEPGLLPAVSVPQSLRAAPAPAAPAANQPAIEMSPNPTGEKAMMTAEDKVFMEAALTSFCTLAEQGESIEASAIWIADEAPDEILSFLHSPIWWGTIAHLFPMAQPHEKWFKNLHARVMALLQEEGPAELPGAALKTG